MSARSIYNYQTDPRLKAVIDTTTDNAVAAVESAYGMTGPTETLTEIMKFFLIHGTFIVVKVPVADSPPTFVILHPEMDDVAINMEPVPRLTFVRYLPLSQKEEKLVIGEDNFRVYEGALADIDFLSLLRFLGYVTPTP